MSQRTNSSLPRFFAEGLYKEKRKGLCAEERVTGCVISSWTFF